MLPLLDIIIVNWNAGQQLHDCLESIVSVRRNGFVMGQVVVVDNASSDDSLDGLDLLPLPLTIIRNPVNQGFGAACNQGASVCDAGYILFLNPDTRLFESSLTVPLAFMEDKGNQKVGICGIQLVNEKGLVSRTCAYFPSLSRFSAQVIGLNKFAGFKGAATHMTEWDHLSEKSVDHVIGAFFFIRRSVFERVQGFDERFFVYLEDIDLSLRACRAGWETVYLVGAQAFHLGGGTSSQVKATRLFYSLRSRLAYSFKHFSPLQAWGVFCLTLLIEPVSRSLFSLFRGGIQDVLNIWRAYAMLYRKLPEILRNNK